VVSCFKINQALHVACLREINACSPSEIRYYYLTLRESTVIVAGLADRRCMREIGTVHMHMPAGSLGNGDRADM
jgi:hypothetical protein